MCSDSGNHDRTSETALVSRTTSNTSRSLNRSVPARLARDPVMAALTTSGWSLIACIRTGITWSRIFRHCSLLEPNENGTDCQAVTEGESRFIKDERWLWRL